jgi:phosphogluconate 2-dehydrogenase
MPKPVVLLGSNWFRSGGATEGLAATLMAKYGEHLDIRPNSSELEGAAREAALAEADALVDFALSPEVIAAAPKVQIAASGGVGYNGQDTPNVAWGGKSLIDLASDAGIWMTNGAGSLTESTADMSLLLLLSVARGGVPAHNWVAKGNWEKEGMGAAQKFAAAGVEPAGKTLGIIGMGRIGQAMARKCVGAFDMDVVYYDISGEATAYTDIPPRWRAAPLDEVLRTADFVSLHCNYSPHNAHLIGRAEFAMMKPTAIFINVSRGPVVSDDALVDALERGEIRRAGLDVTEFEPKMSAGMLALCNTDKLMVMPHVGSGTAEGRDAMLTSAFENVYQVLVEKVPPQSPINGFGTPQGQVVYHLPNARVAVTPNLTALAPPAEAAAARL